MLLNSKLHIGGREVAVNMIKSQFTVYYLKLHTL